MYISVSGAYPTADIIPGYLSKIDVPTTSVFGSLYPTLEVIASNVNSVAADSSGGVSYYTVYIVSALTYGSTETASPSPSILAPFTVNYSLENYKGPVGYSTYNLYTYSPSFSIVAKAPSLAISPPSTSVSLLLQGNTDGSITTKPAAGSFSYTDTDTSTTVLIGSDAQTATAVDAKGNAVLLTSAQVAALEAPFSATVSPATGGSGSIDWRYDASKSASALGFLAGDVATVTSNLTIVDGDGNSEPATVTVTVDGPPASLFTTSSETVDFNNLTSDQQAAVQNGANLYNGLGGSDVVTLPDVANYNESVGNGDTLEFDPSQTFVTGSKQGDTYSVTGSGGSYNIQLRAGNDKVTINGNGSSTITAGSGSDTITINGSGANTINVGTGTDKIALATEANDIVFTGASETATLVLPAVLTEDVSDFVATDTIDLSGLTANEDVYNPQTGELQLYDTTYGQSAVQVADLDVTGNFNAYSFALSPDVSGGTDLELGAPPPSLNDLANLANTVGTLTSSSSNGGVYHLLQTTGANGFYAAAYGLFGSESLDYPDQIVIVYRGTDPSNVLTASDLTFTKNIIADASFLGTIDNAYLPGYIQQASEFLKSIRSNPDYESADITLTGHSLGGGVAALVGAASAYPTVTFDAPGAAQIQNDLYSQLAAAHSSNSELSSLIVPFNSKTSLPDASSNNSINTAYRLEGDQVSLSGKQIGSQYTFINSSSTNLFQDISDHFLGTLIPFLGEQPIAGHPDAPLSGLVNPDGSVLNGPLLGILLPTIGVVAGALSYIDPAGASDYQLMETSSSPLFASIALPSIPGVASYDVSLESNGAWSAEQGLAPDTTLTPSTSFSAADITPVDSNGNEVQLGTGIVFEVSFATSGSFTGQIVADVGSDTGDNPVVSSPSLSVAESATATPIGIIAPNDPDYAASQLTIAVTSLPSNGIVTLADGVTPVTVGEDISLAQLTGLAFTPGSGASAASSSLTYITTDPANNASIGTATLGIMSGMSAAVAPTISGTVTGQATMSEAPLAPFAGATVGDNNTGASDTLTITLGGAGGTLIEGPGFNGLADTGPGTYTLAGTAAAVTGELDAVSFTPTAGAAGTSSTTTFTLSDASSADATPVTDATTSVVDTDPFPTAPALFGALTHDVTSAGGDIYALYETILGRAPDPVGLEGYVADLNGGTPLATIAQDFLASPEYTAGYGAVSQSSDQAFISQLYQDGLGRAPDPGGLQIWENALEGGGLSRAQVAVDIATSPEAQGDLAATFQAGVFVPNATDASVARLYYGLLGRAPDAGGLALWEGADAGGTSLTQVAQDFLASPEYATTAVGQSNTQFVQGLYQSALGRAGDQTGLQGWEVALDTGSVTRAGVVNGFLSSSEFQADTTSDTNAQYIDEVYQVALGRQVDPGGMQGWGAALAAGLSRTTFDQDITGSAEFQANVTAPAQAAFVNALYEGAFGGTASPGALQTASSALAGGASLASLAAGVLESPAAQGQLAPKIEAGFQIA